MRGFVDTRQCRQRQICEHFGEKPKWEACGMCDVCQGTVVELEEEVTVASKKAAKIVSTSPVDEDLRAYLREWRRTTAKEQGAPAFVVMHDTALEEICRWRPHSIAELMTITGFGERKAKLYGPPLFAALRRFEEGARASASPRQTSRPAAETRQLLAEGHSLQEIAAIRGRQFATVINAVAELIESGEVAFNSSWVEVEKCRQIETACARLGTAALRPIKDAVAPEISFEEIRLVAAKVRREAKCAAAI
jgi:ATP-dependent DNA helicase RecQ